MCKPRVTKKHEITVVSVEIAAQNSFSKSWNKIKIFRLHVVGRWVIDIEDRINSHGDPEDLHTSGRVSNVNFWELEWCFYANQ